MQRIFVTGLGVVSAIGNDCAENLFALQNGISGLAHPKFLNTIYKDYLVGEVKLSNSELCQMLQINQQIDVRTALLGIAAAKRAVNQALLYDRKNDLRIAFVSGTTVGGMDNMERYYLDFTSNDSKNHLIYPHDIGDNSEYIADYFGDMFCFVTSVSTACSAASNAIILAAKLIENNRADVVVCGGTESLSKYHFNGFNSLKIIDRDACRPFSADRNGLNLGEGAGYIVLESEKVAIDKQIELVGYANTCDAFHQTASSPDGNGAFLAMTSAIEMAKINPSDIDFINCHGTSTVNNDLSESIALKRVFGDNVPYFTSTKAHTGHTTSASGGIEAVFSILSLKNNFLPKTLNLTSVIEQTNLKPLTENINKEIVYAMSNNYGFGGNDSSLIFRKNG